MKSWDSEQSNGTVSFSQFVFFEELLRKLDALDSFYKKKDFFFLTKSNIPANIETSEPFWISRNEGFWNQGYMLCWINVFWIWKKMNFVCVGRRRSNVMFFPLLRVGGFPPWSEREEKFLSRTFTKSKNSYILANKTN